MHCHGDWKDGLYHGNRYEGGFVENLSSGHSDGKYTGEFKHDFRQGHGTMHYTSGDSYEVTGKEVSAMVVGPTNTNLPRDMKVNTVMTSSIWCTV